MYSHARLPGVAKNTYHVFPCPIAWCGKKHLTCTIILIYYQRLILHQMLFKTVYTIVLDVC